MQTISATQANAEIPINENFDLLRHLSTYSRNPVTTTGLTWGYFGGTWSGVTITTATLTLTASSTNYVVVLNSSGVLSTSTTNTNWNNNLLYSRVYIVTTSASAITSYVDYRGGFGGVFGQMLNPVLTTANNVFTKRQVVTPAALTYSASIAVDASLSNSYTLTLTGDAALNNPSNLVNGTDLVFRIKQDATGSRLLTFGSMYLFGSTSPTLSTTPNSVDLIRAYYNSTDNNLICTIDKGY